MRFEKDEFERIIPEKTEKGGPTQHACFKPFILSIFVVFTLVIGCGYYKQQIEQQTKAVVLNEEDASKEDMTSLNQLHEVHSTNGLMLFDRAKRFGGFGGTQTNFVPESDEWYIYKMRICDNEYVGEIKAWMKNWKTGEVKYTKLADDGESQSCTWTNVHDYPRDCIRAIHIRSGKYIDQIEFVQANGVTTKRGRGGGSPDIAYFENGCFSGFKGGGGYYVDWITPYYTQIPEQFLDPDSEPLIRYTQYYGGGNGNTFKIMPFGPNWSPYSLIIRSGRIIDSIKMEYRSDETCIIKDDGWKGNDGGDLKEIFLDQNDCINKVELWMYKQLRDDYIDGMVFHFRQNGAYINRAPESFGKVGESDVMKTIKFKQDQCLVGFIGKINDPWITAVSFATQEKADVTRISHAKTIGRWKRIETQRQINTKITVSSSSTTGESLTKAESQAYSHSLSLEQNAKAGGDTAGWEIGYKIQYSFGYNKDWSSSSTESSQISYGKDKERTIQCSDDVMGFAPKEQGVWSAWQWTLQRDEDEEGRPGFSFESNEYYCTDSVTKPPKYPPHLCKGVMCQEKSDQKFTAKTEAKRKQC